MVTNNFTKSELDKLYYVVQNSLIIFPKQIVIETLRNFFADDLYYRYVQDAFGFPKVVDQTNTEGDSGINDDLTTRIYIGEFFKNDVSFYPSVLVKYTGSSSVPISLNRETGSVEWQNVKIVDGYGNYKFYKSPKNFIFAGAWEGSLSIDISTRSVRSRDEISQIIALLFTDIAFNALSKSGLVVKKVSVGSPSESDDRNDKLFHISVSLEIRTEWRRLIPVANVIEIISTSIEFGRVDGKTPPAPNLTINMKQSLVDILLNF